MSIYRGMDKVALDAAYNNSAAVVDSPAILAGWTARSARLAAEKPQHLDLRYGPAERNRIDYFPARQTGPLLIFIHGGYWQMRDKETFRFVAEGPLARGVNVALVAYTLAPDKRFDGIVAEVRAAIGWLASHVEEYGGDPGRLYLLGWSAGGHLTAMCLNEPSVRGGLAISGIYDLEPMRLCYVNDKLGLDEAEARRNSPLLNLPQRSPPLMLACGGDELPELRRQTTDFAEARWRAGLPGRLVVLPAHNHFTILEELAHPEGALTEMVMELIRSF